MSAGGLEEGQEVRVFYSGRRSHEHPSWPGKVTSAGPKLAVIEWYGEHGEGSTQSDRFVMATGLSQYGALYYYLIVTEPEGE